MAEYNVPNYFEQGTGTLVLGGDVKIPTGATGAVASTTKAGLMKQGAAVADAAGSAPTAAEFKALLDSLRAAGIIATAT